MAIFMLETDAVTSAASAIGSLTSQMNNVANSINSYDTSCEDGFDFSNAKSVLSSNIEACSTKIKNTSVVLENVVSAHTKLQSSMKFDGSDDFSADKKTSSDSSTSNESSSSGGGNYSGGSYSGNSSSAFVSGGAIAGGTAVSNLVSEEATDNLEKSEEDDLEDEKNDNSTNGLEKEVTTELNKVNYAYVNNDIIPDESKKLFDDETFKYDDNTGYALVDGKYVIACDSSVGEVGDVIKFTQKDDSVVECVVGVNTVTDSFKNSISFIVDKENWSNKTPLSFSENLINNTTSITNVGQYNLKSDEVITLINKDTEITTDTDLSNSVTADIKEV